MTDTLTEARLRAMCCPHRQCKEPAPVSMLSSPAEDAALAAAGYEIVPKALVEAVRRRVATRFEHEGGCNYGRTFKNMERPITICTCHHKELMDILAALDSARKEKADD